MRLALQMSENPNYSRLRTLLFNKGILEPEGFKDFAELYLPYDELPNIIRFDGSFGRARWIINTPEFLPIVYGDYNSRLFAVQYNWNNEEYLTIFMEGIDFRREFIEGLKMYVPQIPYELAVRISNTLIHDRYYALSRTVYYDNSKNIRPDDRERVVMQFANLIAWKTFSRPGDDVMDVLNGLTGVFSLNRKNYVDIDDAAPACFIINGILYIYNP